MKKLAIILALLLPANSLFAAATMFLRNSASQLGTSIAQNGSGYGCYSTTTTNWNLLATSTTAGSAAVSKTAAPTSTAPPCPTYDGTNFLLWFSPPLSAGLTVSGTISFEVTCNESAAQLNSGYRMIVQRWSVASGGIVSTIITSAIAGTECGGTRQAITAASSTSTTMVTGDRFVIRPEVEPQGGSWAGNGSRTVTLSIEAASGSNGDTSVTFTTDTPAFSADSNNAPRQIFNSWLRRRGVYLPAGLIPQISIGYK